MNNLFAPKRKRLFQLEMLRKGTQAKRRTIPAPDSSVFERCASCSASLPYGELKQNLYVCPACGAHFSIDAYRRLGMVMDKGSMREFNSSLTSPNVLKFPGYDKKLDDQREKTGLSEAAVTVRGKIDGMDTVAAVLDSRFMMGSMGTAVGEKITRAVEYAGKLGLPLIIFSASGGARMQEGILSLMQMAKTAAAIERFGKAGGFYISVLTHPTTGGVSASFASLGDIILAEPGALIGFAGPRVIEQTLGQTLPEGFQSAEFQQEHGFVDRIVERTELKRTLSQLLRLHGGRAQ